MPQGKFKKSKLPDALQNKKKHQKHGAFTRRPNAPIQAKKAKYNETQKIKAVISKSVNKSVEKELRSRAHDGVKQLSKAQEAVVKHHATHAAAQALIQAAAAPSKSGE